MISIWISSFFFYTFSFFLDIIKSPQNKNKKVETNMYKDYNTGQTALRLNLDFAIPSNHLANAISWFVDSVLEEYFQTERLSWCFWLTSKRFHIILSITSDPAAMPMNWLKKLYLLYQSIGGWGANQWRDYFYWLH